MNNFLIKDSKGVKSLTATVFLIGFVVVNIKLLVSGMDLGVGFKFSDFTGIDYAASLSALGAIYIMRRNGGKSKKEVVE